MNNNIQSIRDPNLPGQIEILYQEQSLTLQVLHTKGETRTYIRDRAYKDRGLQEIKGRLLDLSREEIENRLGLSTPGLPSPSSDLHKVQSILDCLIEVAKEEEEIETLTASIFPSARWTRSDLIQDIGSIEGNKVCLDTEAGRREVRDYHFIGVRHEPSFWHSYEDIICTITFSTRKFYSSRQQAPSTISLKITTYIAGREYDPDESVTLHEHTIEQVGNRTEVIQAIAEAMEETDKALHKHQTSLRSLAKEIGLGQVL